MTTERGEATARLLDDLEAALETFAASPAVESFARAGVPADAIALDIRMSCRANPEVAARRSILDRFVDAAQRVTIAAHESGHATVGWLLGDRPRWVTIDPEPQFRGVFLGYADFPIDKPINHGFLDRAAVSLAGAVAERALWQRIPGARGARLFGLPFLGSRSYPPADLEAALTYAAPQRLHLAAALAEEVLVANWTKMIRVADKLLDKKYLDGNDVDTLLLDAPIERWCCVDVAGFVLRP